MQQYAMHEEFSVSGQVESAKEALESEIPSLDREHEQIIFLRSLHGVLVAVLSGDIRKNPYFFSPAGDDDVPGQIALRRTREKLTRFLCSHAEHLSSAKDAARVTGWNRLMMCWIIVAQIYVCLDRVRTTPLAPVDSASIFRNELATTGGGTNDVLLMSMAELRFALTVFRDRLTMLDTVDAGINRYMLLLELRASQFICNTVPSPDDYDVPVWISVASTTNSRKIVSREFILTMTWWFVWIKRYILSYLTLSAASFYGNAVSPGRVVSIIGTTSPELDARRATLTAFLRTYATTMNTTDHQRDFSDTAVQYNVSPGDLDVDTHLHGLGGIDRSTVRDVVSHRRTPTASTYVTIRKFYRPLAHWLDAFSQRVALSGKGRFVGGGSSCEAFFEQLAILHVLNAFFVSRRKVSLIKWFVITHRGSGPSFELDVLRGIRNHFPFIIQRLGRFSCCVPELPPSHSSSHHSIERELGICPSSDEASPHSSTVLYDCHDILDAIVIWASFLLSCWGGRITHSNKHIAPLLRCLIRPKLTSPPLSSPLSSPSSSAIPFKS